VIGIQFGLLLSGAILTETIFAWPGIGKWIYHSISARDFPAVQGGILFISFFFVMINLVVDLLYSVINPRIRLSNKDAHERTNKTRHHRRRRNRTASVANPDSGKSPGIS
jgi:ABC-type antimicrobial peptide transport system permease subunit